MTGILKLLARGIFSVWPLIIALLYIALMSFGYKKRKRHRKQLFVLIFLIYIFAIEPVRDKFVVPLEDRHPVVKQEELETADAYILLGGGIYEKAPLSLGVEGIPSRTALPRLVETVRLYRKYPKKIYISGGALDGNKVSETEVYSKFLEDMGVEQADLYLDSDSRTTYENGKYISEQLKLEGVEKPVLVTSALHMDRSVRTFKGFGVDVIPAPCGYITERNGYTAKSFIPTFQNLSDVRDAFWEYIGAVYYKLKFKKKGDN
jgi:uncharacterized SAM-binding protein YcdF (DUF218 family)